jgi:hypothetical protein
MATAKGTWIPSMSASKWRTRPAGGVVGRASTSGVIWAPRQSGRDKARIRAMPMMGFMLPRLASRVRPLRVATRAAAAFGARGRCGTPGRTSSGRTTVARGAGASDGARRGGRPGASCSGPSDRRRARPTRQGRRSRPRKHRRTTCWPLPWPRRSRSTSDAAKVASGRDTSAVTASLRTQVRPR